VNLKFVASSNGVSPPSCAATRPSGPAADLDRQAQARPVTSILWIERAWRCAVETMIGIAVLFVGVGIAWLCFAVGVYFLTRTGREGMRIQRMEDERQQRLAPER
jgi:hypothetical protein